MDDQAGAPSRFALGFARYQPNPFATGSWIILVTHAVCFAFQLGPAIAVDLNNLY